LVGITNVGKSSVVAAMVNAFGQQRDHLAPTASIYPRTTLGNVQLPVDLFMRPGTRTYSRACVFDTPGLEGDQAFLQSFIDVEYERAVSLIKVGGFQRPADKMTPGNKPPYLPITHLSLFALLAWADGQDNR